MDFVGFHVGWDVYKSTEKRLAAIRNFSMRAEPTLIDIRFWHGLVNQLASFLATIMEPFRELLRKQQAKNVYWDANLQEKFQQDKDIICKLTLPSMTSTDLALW